MQKGKGKILLEKCTYETMKYDFSVFVLCISSHEITMCILRYFYYYPKTIIISTSYKENVMERRRKKGVF